MPTINLTVESENRYNSVNRTQGFDTDRIVQYYANPNADVDGNTIVEYVENDYSGRIKVYGVTESVSYIAAEINGGSTVSSVQIALSSADILALNGTPIEGVAAAGAGMTIIPIAATISYTYGTGAYTANRVLQLVYETGGGIAMNTGALTPFSGGSSKLTNFVPLACYASANKALQIQLAAGDEAAGDGTATVEIKYLIVG